MICEDILKLTEYGMVTGLVPKEDERFTINRLLELFELEELDEDAVTAYQSRTPMSREEAEESLEELLNRLLDYAYEKGILKENSVVYRDLFDTKIMGMLMPRPGEVIHKFQSLYEKDAKAATDYYYTLSQDSNYIRRYRIRRDMKWTAETEFGELDITINLSKPEKDPKAIAAAKLAKQSGYPKCLLCKENEGYAGRVNHPARQNHRIIPVTINHSDWFLQYSPYVYYNEHCIVFNGKHTPMKIEKATFEKLLDFVKQFPHYFVGSNADLPIVGGSILSHDHFQGGHYEFAMAKAPLEKEITFAGFEDVKAGIRYLRAHAGRFHIDPEKIGVMGESAGGYLTCMAALATDPSFDVGENLEYSSSVQAACPWYPPTDFRGFPYDSAEQCAAAPESLLLGKNVMRHAGEALKCCPVSFVTPEAPPFLIIHGKDDHTVSFTQSELLYEKLEKAGCDVTLLAIEGADHADLHFFQEKIWEEIGDFFRKSLGNVR